MGRPMDTPPPSVGSNFPALRVKKTNESTKVKKDGTARQRSFARCFIFLGEKHEKTHRRRDPPHLD